MNCPKCNSDDTLPIFGGNIKCFKCGYNSTTGTRNTDFSTSGQWAPLPTNAAYNDDEITLRLIGEWK